MVPPVPPQGGRKPRKFIMICKAKSASMQFEPVQSEIQKFYRFFHYGHETTFLSFTKNGRPAGETVQNFGTLNSVIGPKLLKANQEGMEVSMLIARTEGPGRKAEQITEIVAVFADFDGGHWSLDQLFEFRVQPQLIVQTSPGNFHAYWKVAGCEVKRFGSVQSSLARSLGSDLNVCDESRVMRMPGTINWKRAEPFLTQIVHIVDSAVPICIDEFIAGMRLEISDEQAAPLVGGNTHDQLAEAVRELSQQQRADVEAALQVLPSEARWLWQRVGMAIHSADNTEIGYALWESWSRNSEKFNESEQQERWRSFGSKGGVNIRTLFWLAKHAAKLPSQAFDEMSLVECFASTLCEQLRYDHRERKWYFFGGVVWVFDDQAPLRAARAFVEAMSGSETGTVHTSLSRFRTAAGLRALVSHAELLKEIHITSDRFDTDPNLLAVQNGVIDLRTGTFRMARATDYLLRQTNVSFDPDAYAERWFKFMKSITLHDKELYRFLRRALGYSLLGHANLQLFFLAIGSGANGKGVLLRTVQKLLGEYARSVAPNLMTTAYSGNVNSPSPALARLQGSRLVVCTELPVGKGLDEAFVKQYAGGDEISARAAYGDIIAFKPEGKLWLSSNDVPHIEASNSAMWRRVKPIPFDACFLGQDADPDLEEELAEEGSGILNWLIGGALSFVERGLGSCPAVDALEERMRKEADSVLAWFEEVCCVENCARTSSSQAYESYLTFCRRAGRRALTQPLFLANLKRKGYEHKKTKTGNVYIGFRLIENINVR